VSSPGVTQRAAIVPWRGKGMGDSRSRCMTFS
jgi:hypothetical protein